jgi:hypothetical protein
MNKEINILAEELRKVAVDFVESASFDDEIKPYPGLRPFEYRENYLFFGREGKAQEIALRLQKNHFIAVVGTSGSGKSSVVRAGLLPLLYGGMLYESGSHWRIAIMRPEETPIRNLAESLIYPVDFESEEHDRRATDETQIGITEAGLRRSGVGLLDFIKNPVNKFAEDENLLIVVDQFEELFRFKGRGSAKLSEEAVAFVKLLLEGTRSEKNRIYVVITMRSDFLGDCAQFQDLPEAINKGQYLIPQLTREQLRQSIESPALVGGAEVSPVLVNRLLNDLDDDPNQSFDVNERLVRDYLPVLQHALMRTWDFWKKKDAPARLIDIEDYEGIGGIQHALSKHADEAYNELSDRQKIIAEKIFKCLTETDSENREIRRPCKIDEILGVIGGSAEEIFEVIEVFRKEGRTFLMPPYHVSLTKDSKIDISHESLIRNWEMLKGWVRDEAENSWLYRRISEDAKVLSEYLEKNRNCLSSGELERNGRDFLWRGIELKDALKWRDNFMPNVAWTSRYQVLTESERQQLSELHRNTPEKESEKRKEFMRLHFEEVKEFLAASAKNEAEEQAEKERFQETKIALERQKTEAAEQLAKAEQDKVEGLRNLTESLKRQRRILFGVSVLSLLLMLISVISSIFAWSNYNSAKAATIKADEQAFITLREKENAERQKNIAEDSRNIAEASQKTAEEQKQIAENEKEKAETERTKAEEQKGIAETEKNNAEKQKEIADAKKQEALDQQQMAEKRKAEVQKINKLHASNIKGLKAFENYDYENAVTHFVNLEGDYNKAISNDSGGIWWANYNIAKSYQQLGQYENAEKYFNNALETLPSDDSLISKNTGSRIFSPVNFLNAAYQSAQSDDDDELKKSKIITLRKFAQFYRNCVTNPGDCFDYENNTLKKSDTDARVLNTKAVDLYKRLIRIKGPIKKTKNTADLKISKQITFLADVKKELADTFLELNKPEEAEVNYEEALSDYDSLEQTKPLTVLFMRQKLLEAKLELNKLEEAEVQTVLIIKKKEELLGKSIEPEKIPLDKSLSRTYGELEDIYRKYSLKAAESYLEKVRRAKAEFLESENSDEKTNQSVESKNGQPSISKPKLNNEERLFFSILESERLTFDESFPFEEKSGWRKKVWDQVEGDFNRLRKLNTKLAVFSQINSQLENFNDAQSKDLRERFSLYFKVMVSYLSNYDSANAKKVFVAFEKYSENMDLEGNSEEKINLRPEIIKLGVFFHLNFFNDPCGAAVYADKWLKLAEDSSNQGVDFPRGMEINLVAGLIYSSCKDCPEDVKRARQILTTHLSIFDKDAETLADLFPYWTEEKIFGDYLNARILFGQTYETEENFGEAARIYNELLDKILLWRKNNPQTAQQNISNTNSAIFDNRAINAAPANVDTATVNTANRAVNSNVVSGNSNTANRANANTRVENTPRIDNRFSFYEAYLNVRLAEFNLNRDENIAKNLEEKNMTDFAKLDSDRFSGQTSLFSRKYATALKNIGDYFREKNKEQAVRYYKGAAGLLEYLKPRQGIYCNELMTELIGSYCQFYPTSGREVFETQEDAKLSSRYYGDYIDILKALRDVRGSDDPKLSEDIEKKIKEAEIQKNILSAKERKPDCRFQLEN